MLLVRGSHCFSGLSHTSLHSHVNCNKLKLQATLVNNSNDKTESASSVSVEKYQHDGYDLTYLYKPAAPGRENDPPLVLIHPVGVGISSWFWSRMMESYDDNPAIYAPDLIGCGIDHGADPWLPEKKGLFFPLSWVQGVETLMSNIILPNQQQQGSTFPWEVFQKEKNTNRGCNVIVQGGLAPVGVVLAKRNPSMVSKLMLTSPPIYQDMVTAVPTVELERNYNFLKSPIWGGLAFAVLENREIIRFFSDLFLFEGKCDDEWLDNTIEESYQEARTPIQAFNAGLLQHRSFEDELQTLTQETWIVSGSKDKRVIDRQSYASEMKKCELKSIEGLNVMPWENTNSIIDLVKDLYL